MIGFSSLEDARRIADSVHWTESYRPATRRLSRRQPATQPHAFVVGKTDAAINKGTFASPSSGTVSVWTGSEGFASMSDSGENITAYNFWGNVASGKQVLCMEFALGWLIIAAEC